MRGSLAYSKGVLYVGTEEKTAHVRCFDLDGRELEAGFSFRGKDGGAASVDGLDLDEDHRLWIADGTGGRLCAYTLFGEEIAGVDSLEIGMHDKGGVLGRAADVVSFGSDDAQELLVASSGARRHALQILQLGSGRSTSLCSMGLADRHFRDLRGVSRREPFIWACEHGGGLVQVFREGEFHFSFRLQSARGLQFRPNAIEALPDGRLLLVQGGPGSAVSLLDSSGRLLRVLAQCGEGSGQVWEPGDLALVPGKDDRHTRVVVIDREGTRVQVFSLTGNCYGAFPGFACSDSAWSPD